MAGGRGETDHVEHRTTTDREAERLPIDPERRHAFVQTADERGVILGALSARHDDRVRHELERRSVRPGVALQVTAERRMGLRDTAIDDGEHAVTAARLTPRERID